MALTSPDNIWTPDPGDLYHPTVSLGGMADSIQDAITALRGNNAPTVRVANVAERTTALADHGTPTSSNPLIVFRADAGAGREIEYTTNGTTWRSLVAEEDTGWVNISIASGFSSQGSQQPQVRRINGIVYTRWGWSNSGMSVSSAYGTIGTIPAGYRPGLSVYLTPTTHSAASTGLMVVRDNGGIELRTGNPLGSYFLLPGTTWPAEN